MSAHTTLVVGAWLFGAITVLLLSGGFVLGPAGEYLAGRLYVRETDRIAADEQQRLLMERLNAAAAATAEPGMVPVPEPASRLGVGELVTRAAGRVADVVLRLARVGARR